MTPYLGEIRRGRDGKKEILAACLDCGKQRWVRYMVRQASPMCLLCISCSNKKRGAAANLTPFGGGEVHPHWKGGRSKSRGYVTIWLSPDDFFYPMAHKDGRVLEHRLIMAQHLGRCLQRWEIVHHKNHIKDDNRWENLQLVSEERHQQITILEDRIRNLEFKVEEQGKQIRLLQWELKEGTLKEKE